MNERGVTYTREPDTDVVSALEAILEMAKSGEVIAVSVGMLYYDDAASYRVSGRAVSYSMIGATTMLLDDLKQHFRG